MSQTMPVTYASLPTDYTGLNNAVIIQNNYPSGRIEFYAFPSPADEYKGNFTVASFKITPKS